MADKIDLLFNQMWNQQDFDLADDLFAKEFIITFSGGQLSDIEEYKSLVKQWFVGFPDLVHQVEDKIVEANKVVVRWRGQGTHMGPFNDIAATGKPFTYHGITIFYIDQDGKITHAWAEMDLPDRLAEL